MADTRYNTAWQTGKMNYLTSIVIHIFTSN